MLKPQKMEKEGLSQKRFKEIKMRLLEEGVFDPNVWEEMNSYQRFWVNETKKSYRDLQQK